MTAALEGPPSTATIINLMLFVLFECRERNYNDVKLDNRTRLKNDIRQFSGILCTDKAKKKHFATFAFAKNKILSAGRNSTTFRPYC